ncbi:MAG TPA: gamma carbonic anhydrase family protein [Polyangiaceae bacterium]|jgi:carbonic anhydrase/acetyltransferase-like protein (isoleucine patch superfamily)
MTLVRSLGDRAPRFGKDVFLADNAVVAGDVVLADSVNVWYGAVLRADVGTIRVGARTNLQDLCCVHMTHDLSHAIIGADVTVGHAAIVHGAVVEDRALIGMGAILLDNARVGHDAFVAAGALVPANMVVPPRTLVWGSPARRSRPLTDEEIEKVREGKDLYLELARLHAGAQANERR